MNQMIPGGGHWVLVEGETSEVIKMYANKKCVEHGPD